MEEGWSLALPAQGLSPEPRAAGTAVAALRDLCGPCCMCFPSWSPLKLALQVPQREVAGQTMTLFPSRVQGAGVQPSLGSFYHSNSAWEGWSQTLSPERSPAGSTGHRTVLGSCFLSQTAPAKPPPFPPLSALPFKQAGTTLLFILLLKQGGPMAMVPGPVRQQGRTGVRCRITLPQLHTQFG